jgi:hypothetical protein
LSLLATYLNDHLAASTGATELVKRTASSNRGNGYGEVLAGLAVEIEEDRRTLEAMMERLGVGRDRVKSTLTWSAEKLGRFKLNGRLLSYSPLSRLEEIELLCLSVEGKLGLWKSLRTALAEDSRLDAFDLDELAERARSQRRRLERLRLKAAEDALTA